MIAREARVGGMPGEEVDSSRVGDEGARTIVELGDDLDDEQSQPGTQGRRDRSATHRREALMARKDTQDHEQQEASWW